MKVDCYNASACLISSLQYGDTFYYDGELYLRVNADLRTDNDHCSCWAVALGNGALIPINPDIPVVLADTKVVANNEVKF